VSVPRAAEGEHRLFVYYKVPEQQASDCWARVTAWLTQLRLEEPGLSVELLRRPQTHDGQQTWMEVYRHPSGVDAMLQARIEARALAQLGHLALQRHAEVFVPLGPGLSASADTPGGSAGTGST